MSGTTTTDSLACRSAVRLTLSDSSHPLLSCSLTRGIIKKEYDLLWLLFTVWANTFLLRPGGCPLTANMPCATFAPRLPFCSAGLIVHAAALTSRHFPQKPRRLETAARSHRFLRFACCSPGLATSIPKDGHITRRKSPCALCYRRPLSLAISRSSSSGDGSSRVISSK